MPARTGRPNDSHPAAASRYELEGVGAATAGFRSDRQPRRPGARRGRHRPPREREEPLELVEPVEEHGLPSDVAPVVSVVTIDPCRDGVRQRLLGLGHVAERSMRNDSGQREQARRLVGIIRCRPSQFQRRLWPPSKRQNDRHRGPRVSDGPAIAERLGEPDHLGARVQDLVPAAEGEKRPLADRSGLRPRRAARTIEGDARVGRVQRSQRVLRVECPGQVDIGGLRRSRLQLVQCEGECRSQVVDPTLDRRRSPGGGPACSARADARSGRSSSSAMAKARSAQG